LQKRDVKECFQEPSKSTKYTKAIWGLNVFAFFFFWCFLMPDGVVTKSTSIG